jgi:hypothetical protein
MTAKLKMTSELRGALRGPSEIPLALVDDNASSGIQAAAQILAWAGIDRQSWPEECRDEDALFDIAIEPELWANILKRPVHLVVCAGRPEAQTRISAAAAQAGLTRFAGLKYSHAIQEAYEWPNDLRVFLSEVGASLMAYTKHQKGIDELGPDQRAACEAKAFGYGNVGGLLATATNVPTSTITALWSPGMHRGAPWMPLMIRQGKIRNLVIG